MTERRALRGILGGLQRVVVLLAASFERVFQWCSTSGNPIVAFLRETIRKQPILLACARAFVRGVRILPRLRQNFQGRSAAVRLLNAIMVARDIGGSVTVEELEQIFQRSRRRRRVLVIADGPESEQIEAVLRATSAKVTSSVPGEADFGSLGQVDLIVAGPGGELGKHSGKEVLRVGRVGKRSDYSSFAGDLGAEVSAGKRLGRPLRERLRGGGPVRVVFLNDAGFQYGAGIALKRQVASMLLKGFEVAVFAWTPGLLREEPPVTGVKHFPGWLGVQDVREIFGDEPGKEIVAGLATRIAALNPDVVITGNMHGAPWPLALLPAIRSQGIHVVAFMHDVYFVTGRCAHPMTCQLYRTGCDASCPTSDEYPRLAPARIAAAWRERGEIFAGQDGVLLIGNSQWTANVARQRFTSWPASRFIHLALDHERFSPIPRSVARRLLGVPERAAIVLLGAVDVKNQWKGGALFHHLHQTLLKREDVGVVLFGYMSEALSSLRSFGLVTDERKMALILNCADVYVSAATAESFGQSLLEASACGVPVVAFDVGAVSEVLVNEQTALLVKEQNVEALLKAIDRLLADPALRHRLGGAARKRVEQRFTLTHQADAWIDLLEKVA